MTVPAPQPIVDAFSLFQDICLVTNGDRAMWLPQTPKLGRLLGLELIESSLKNYAPFFLKVGVVWYCCGGWDCNGNMNTFLCSCSVLSLVVW